jgi:hypothetical protein
MTRRSTASTTCIPLCTAALLQFGCTATDESRPAVAVRDSAAITIVENDLTRLGATCSLSAEPDVSIGVEEGPEEYQLFRVFGARRLSDGRIALVNQGSQQLRFYDQEGRFLSASGRAGNGPGEFRDAFHLWVLPGDTIWVGDYRAYRYLVFAPNGEWQRNVQPDPIYPNPPGLGTLLANGRAVLADRTQRRYPGTVFEPRRYTVVIHESDGSLLDTIGTFDMGRWGKMSDEPQAMTLYPLFESFARLASVGPHIVHGHMSKAEYIMLADADGFPVERIVRWTSGDRTISASDIEAERERIAAPFADMNPAERRRFLDPLIDPNRPIADEFPAYAGLTGGRDGRVWVREYPRPKAPDPQHWIAFDQDGRFSCRATIPVIDKVWPPGSLLEFGADYILVLHKDDLGVERVLQFGLGAPAGGPEN